MAKIPKAIRKVIRILISVKLQQKFYTGKFSTAKFSEASFPTAQNLTANVPRNAVLRGIKTQALFSLINSSFYQYTNLCQQQ